MIIKHDQAHFPIHPLPSPTGLFLNKAHALYPLFTNTLGSVSKRSPPTPFSYSQ